jgi:hypothetical protein
LRVKSATVTANFSLLLYGLTCGGMLLLLAPVFILPPVRGATLPGHAVTDEPHRAACLVARGIETQVP